MEIYNSLSRVPPDALKPISAGRLKGKSDINPQWRFEAMTKVFGQVGVGWKYEIVRLWREDGAEGNVFAFAQVNVYTKGKEVWSDPIPGIGGSELVSKESSGLYSNDEAYKMALTDALSVAFKALGVAADIYRGLWDGSKYKDKPNTTTKDPAPALAAIEESIDIEHLQDAFKRAWNDYPNSRKELSEAKDRRKQALLQNERDTIF